MFIKWRIGFITSMIDLQLALAKFYCEMADIHIKKSKELRNTRDELKQILSEVEEGKQNE